MEFVFCDEREKKKKEKHHTIKNEHWWVLLALSHWLLLVIKGGISSQVELPHAKILLKWSLDGEDRTWLDGRFPCLSTQHGFCYSHLHQGFWAVAPLAFGAGSFFVVRGGCPVNCRMLSSTPGLHALDASSISPSVVTTKHVCGYHPLPPGGQHHSQWRATGLQQAN